MVEEAAKAVVGTCRRSESDHVGSDCQREEEWDREGVEAKATHRSGRGGGKGRAVEAGREASVGGRWRRRGPRRWALAGKKGWRQGKTRRGMKTSPGKRDAIQPGDRGRVVPGDGPGREASRAVDGQILGRPDACDHELRTWRQC